MQGDVPCNQNSVQGITAISSLCSVCVTPTELYGTTFHHGVVNTVLTTRRATRRCLIHSFLVFSLSLSFL